jgi:hypothetical protein
MPLGYSEEGNSVVAAAPSLWPSAERYGPLARLLRHPSAALRTETVPFQVVVSLMHKQVRSRFARWLTSQKRDIGHQAESRIIRGSN